MDQFCNLSYSSHQHSVTFSGKGWFFVTRSMEWCWLGHFPRGSHRNSFLIVGAIFESSDIFCFHPSRGNVCWFDQLYTVVFLHPSSATGVIVLTPSVCVSVCVTILVRNNTNDTILYDWWGYDAECFQIFIVNPNNILASCPNGVDLLTKTYVILAPWSCCCTMIEGFLHWQ